MTDSTSRGTRWLPVLAGGLVIAAGDMTLAMALWFPWTTAGVERLFQSIAVGVLGQASFQGGAGSALLGAALHVSMTTTFVTVYTLASRWWPRLLQRPILDGAAYGLLLYVVMNFVAMPLSRVGRSPSFDHPDWIGISVLCHLAFGVVCVIAAQHALGWRRTAAQGR